MKNLFLIALNIISSILVFTIPSLSVAEETKYVWKLSTDTAYADSSDAACQMYANPNWTYCGLQPNGTSAFCKLHNISWTDPGTCYAQDGVYAVQVQERYALFAPDNNQNAGCPGYTGNPVDTISGNKYQHEQLLKIDSPHPIVFDLYFNSKRTEGWRHSYSRSVKAANANTVTRYAINLAKYDSPFFAHESSGSFSAPEVYNGVGMKDTSSVPVAVSSTYLTRQEACEQGWTSFRSRFHYAWISGSSAVFVNGGKCRINDADGNQRMLLDVYGFYSGRAAIESTVIPVNYLRFTRENGSVIIFSNVDWYGVNGAAGTPASVWVNQSNTGERAENILSGTEVIGYRFFTADDSIEDYDVQGRLLTITAADGHVQTLSYDDITGLLSHVQNETGEYLDFAYEDFGDTNQYQRLISVTDHTGRSWGFRYLATDNLEFVDNPDGTARQYHYEDPTDARLLTGITDERSMRYATWIYDNKGRATSSAHGPGADIDRVEITYAPTNSGIRTVTKQRKSAVTGIITPLVSTYTTHTGGDAPLVAEITGPGCSSCGVGNVKYEHDAKTGYLEYKIEHGVRTEYGNYDSNGNPGYIIEAVGTPQQRRTDYTYDPRFHNKVATISEPSVLPGASKVTINTYDDYGNLTSTAVHGYKPDGTPVSRATTYQYAGPYHQLSQIDGPRSDVTDVYTLNYYPMASGYNSARLQSILTPNGLALRNNIQYTATGKINSESRGNLSISYEYYPGNDRLLRMTELDGSALISRITEWTYLPTGEVETIRTGAGTADETMITLGYDSARRLIRITDGLGNHMDYVLDSEGNVEKEEIYDNSGVLSKTLTQTFDNYNRLDNYNEANQRNNSDYSADGTLDKATDGNGVVTDYSYDSLLRLTSVKQDVGGTDVTTANALTQLGYDEQDNLISVTDANNAQTIYVYDDLGNLLQQTSPDTGITTFTYDEAGNIKTRLTAKNQMFNYNHDALNRVTLQDGPGLNADIIYTYDTCDNGSGRLCSLNKSNNSVTYAYDAFGHVTRHQGVSYSYDTVGRIKTMSYPSGAVVTYGYDAAGQVNNVQLVHDGSITNLVSNATYEPFGAANSLLYGNGQSLLQIFNDDYRLQSQSVGSVMAFDYTQYDDNGNLKHRNSDSFNYDANNRLDNASGVFGALDYAYNKTGNRTQLITGATITDYIYAANSNRMTAAGVNSVTIDANGNLTNQDARKYNYTSANNLSGAYNGTTLLGNYQYNGLNQRISKNVSSNKSSFSYGLNNELLVETSGATSREYIYFDGQPLAILDTTTATTIGSGITPTSTPAIKGSNLNFAWNGISTPSAYDWVGIYAVGSADAWSDLDSWMYTNGNAAGNLSLNLKATDARLIAGQNYELRLYADDGYDRLATSAPFVLNPVGPTVIASSTPAILGGTLNVAWSGITGPTAGDWIGVYTPGSNDVNYLDWIYTGGTSAGNSSITLSDTRLTPGQQYELRLFSNDDYIRLATGGSFTLAETSGTPASSNLYYIHNDHLGTPQVLTDEAGTTVWGAVYDPFGQASVSPARSVEFNLRFPGQYYDAETGLYYNLYRYYDSGTGRYISSDPIGLMGGLNTYAYVTNNPLRYTDSNGLCGLGCFAAGTALTAVAVTAYLHQTGNDLNNAINEGKQLTDYIDNPSGQIPNLDGNNELLNSAGRAGKDGSLLEFQLLKKMSDLYKSKSAYDQLKSWLQQRGIKEVMKETQELEKTNCMQ